MAIEVSIHAVSPLLGVQFVRTAGTAGTAAYLSVASIAATAPAQAGTDGGGGLAAAGAGAAGSGVADAAGAGVADAAGAGVGEGTGVGDADCARGGAGAAKPISAAIASAGARPDKNRDNFILRTPRGKAESGGGANAQKASSSFSPVRIRTAESRP